MNREDIIRMARGAGFKDHGNPELWDRMVAADEVIARFFRLAFNLGYEAGSDRNKLIAEGWRQCAQGQKTTQFCAVAEQARQDAERHKASAAMWRNKAYELGGYSLSWDADEMLEQARQEEREACVEIADNNSDNDLIARAIRARGNK